MGLTIEQAFKQAIEQHKKGNLQEAERLYRAILHAQPMHPDANHNLGVLAVAVGKAESALPLFKQALKVNSQVEQFWISYIDALIRVNNIKFALEAVEQAKEIGISDAIISKLKKKIDEIISNSNLLDNSFEPQSATLSRLKRKILAKKEKRKSYKQLASIADSPSVSMPTQEELQLLLGYYNSQNYVAAEGLARSLTVRFPSHSFGWKVLGVVLSQTGRHQEALGPKENAVELSPGDAASHSNLGNALYDLGRLDEAEESYRQAIELKPDFADAHSNLGNALNALGRLDEAEISYRYAIKLDPNYAQAHYNLGNILKYLGRLNEAETSYRCAIKLNPNYAQAHSNLGNALHDLGRLDEAEESYRHAIKLRPVFAEAQSNLGNSLYDLGRLDEAEESYRQAIKVKPDFSEAHYNLGNMLNNLGRLDEAETSYQHAITLKADYTEAHSNLGNVLQDLGRLDEAEASYRRAIKLKPDYAEAIHNLSLLQLLTGQFEEGWSNNEFRKQIKKEPSGSRPFSVPLWHASQPIKDKTILVHAEQGLGDTIQMCRYLKKIVGSGADVLFAPQRQLQRLLSTLDAKIKMVDVDDPNLRFDYHCPIMSLPLAFKTTLDTIPNDVPYLSAEDARVSKWQEKIGTHGLKIGICWGGSKKGVSLSRTFPITQFYNISQIEGVRLISIHKGDGEKELERLPDGMKIEVLGDDFDKGEQAFLDTAAVMKCCDLVITSDTAITVLGGALAVPTWVALKYIPHWFWMLDRPDSPWYPTIRLFRQTKTGDWDGVFDQIRLALLEILSQNK